MIGKRKTLDKNNVENNMEKQSLVDYVRDKGPLQLEEICSITLSLCEALENIDHLGRYPQLKLSNIMVSESGKAHLIFSNILKPDKDFISIGMIMYFIITGKIPFTVLEPTFDENYDDNIDDDLKRIIGKCFETDTRNQYASIKELSKDLSIMILKKNLYRQTRELYDTKKQVSIVAVSKRVRRSNKSKEKLKVTQLYTVLTTVLKPMRDIVRKGKEILIFR
jgi:serine/threonine protein kinase